MRALGPRRSKPLRKLTSATKKPVLPGEVDEYSIEMMAAANMFEAWHRIYGDVARMTTGVSGATHIEHIPNRICSHRTTLHKIRCR